MSGEQNAACCCGAAYSSCDCCPVPFPGFDTPAWQVTIASGGQQSCVAGDGGIYGGFSSFTAYCLCGSCDRSMIAQSNLRRISWDSGQIECDTAGPPCNIIQNACEDCLSPGAEPNSPFPGGIATLRTYGCRIQGDWDPPTLCGAPSVGIVPGNPFNCQCCDSEVSNCDGDGDLFYQYDDIPDGISYVSNLYRCRRRPESCCPMEVDNPDPTDTRIWTMIRVSFYAPGFSIQNRHMGCVNVQGAWQLQCQVLPDTIVDTGQVWSCVYARPQRPCEFYAEGQYRCVYAETSGCTNTFTNVGESSPCSCNDGCPGGLTQVCNWDGVSLKSLDTKWLPPSTITVTRIQ